MTQACSGGNRQDNGSNGNMSNGVYKAINAVQAALAKTGISKDRTNTQGSGYKFRGIDDVYNAVAPLLAEHGLCILPRMTERSCEERQSNAGKALFYTVVKAEFDFVAADDGSKHTVVTYGEAMDSGDKSTNKAMSAAYKYAAFQAFAIPTEGDNDADAHTPEVVARMPEGAVLDWIASIESQASRAEVLEVREKAKKACEAANDRAAYDRIQKAARARVEKLNASPQNGAASEKPGRGYSSDPPEHVNSNDMDDYTGP